MVKHIQVKPLAESLEYIREHRCSVARFGEGEIDLIAGFSIPYQDYHPDLAAELGNIISQESTEDFLVCLPDVFNGLERYNENARLFWQGHLERLGSLYDEHCQAPWYGSAFISRPYIDLEEKTSAADYFAQMKQIWADQDVLIVEGETSRSGSGNDLFAQAKSVSRIVCPSKNAYHQYHEIEQAIRRHGKDKLVLLMLGPTAKVLSYHLAQEGYWTIDMGHIDSEYEWFLMGASYKVKLDHKHTAEHNYDEAIVFKEDKEYDQQILENIAQPLISIIVPVYNVETYVRACLESILKQTYTNIEVLVINDGSSDSSSEICREFAAKDKRIQLIHKGNGGLSDARNLGLENASGKYVCFVDSDDTIEPFYIERLHNQAVKHQAQIVVCDFVRLVEEEATYYFHTKESYTKTLTATEYFDEIFTSDSTEAFVAAWAKLIDRSLFDGEFPIRFPVGRLAEDKYVTYLLAWKAQKIVYLHEPNYCYRIRSGSIVRSGANNLIKRTEDDLLGCEQRMLDFILMGYDTKHAVNWYHYILNVHSAVLEHYEQTNTEIYKRIRHKLALINKEYK